MDWIVLKYSSYAFLASFRSLHTLLKPCNFPFKQKWGCMFFTWTHLAELAPKNTLFIISYTYNVLYNI